MAVPLILVLAGFGLMVALKLRVRVPGSGFPPGHHEGGDRHGGFRWSEWDGGGWGGWGGDAGCGGDGGGCGGDGCCGG